MRAAGFAGGIGPRGKERMFPPHVASHQLSSAMGPLADDRLSSIPTPPATLQGLNDFTSHVETCWRCCVLKTGHCRETRFDFKPLGHRRKHP